MQIGVTAMSTSEPWVSVEDVAGHLGVVRDSVYRWIDGRGLPAHKIGRIWKFKLSEVDDWVRAGGAGYDEPRDARRATPAPKRRTTSRKT